MITEHVGHEISDPSDYQDILNQTDLDWNVEVTDGIGAKTSSGEPVYTSQKCATVRTDNNRVLGIVGPNYKVVQNSELALMAHRLHGRGVSVVHGGAIANGERVFLGLKMPSFGVGHYGDEVQPYTILVNGHDGKNATLGMATTRRPICDNVLNAPSNLLIESLTVMVLSVIVLKIF